MAGVGAGGTVGGLIGALSGASLPEYEAKRYQGRVASGNVLLSVHCATDDAVTTAKAVLRHAGGDDVASAGEERAD